MLNIKVTGVVYCEEEDASRRGEERRLVESDHSRATSSLVCTTRNHIMRRVKDHGNFSHIQMARACIPMNKSSDSKDRTSPDCKSSYVLPVFPHSDTLRFQTQKNQVVYIIKVAAVGK